MPMKTRFRSLVALLVLYCMTLSPAFAALTCQLHCADLSDEPVVTSLVEQSPTMAADHCNKMAKAEKAGEQAVDVPELLAESEWAGFSSDCECAAACALGGLALINGRAAPVSPNLDQALLQGLDESPPRFAATLLLRPPIV